MSENSSSASYSSSYVLFCTNFGVSTYISIAISVVRFILLLPLSILILYLGHQRWRQQRSFKTTSHSDIFTYHMAVMEIIWCLGSLCYLCGIFADLMKMTMVAIYSTSIVFYGQTLFHLLTCVERYLAVVHPVTYMGLRNVRGVRIRNITIGCVWLLSFVTTCLVTQFVRIFPAIPFLCLFAFCFIVICFCNLSVLCVLIRPGPGEGSQGKERVDQSKQRAFHTITAIMGVLLLWFVGLLLAIALQTSPLLSKSVGCVVLVSSGWFNLPSNFLLPMLYLHRAGKLSCC